VATVKALVHAANSALSAKGTLRDLLNNLDAALLKSTSSYSSNANGACHDRAHGPDPVQLFDPLRQDLEDDQEGQYAHAHHKLLREGQTAGERKTQLEEEQYNREETHIPVQCCNFFWNTV
jgi:hypothetical protein